MGNQLKLRRENYAQAKSLLGRINQLKHPLPETKSMIMSILNKRRAALAREIKRVSWLLWPETGRPYSGTWQVVNQLNNAQTYVGTLENCLRFIERSKYGQFYRVKQNKAKS